MPRTTRAAVSMLAVSSILLSGTSESAVGAGPETTPPGSTLGWKTSPLKPPSVRPTWMPRGSAFYAAPIRTPGGRVDIQRTIAATKSLGGGQYWYLLYPKSGGRMPVDWETLPAFLAAADRARISVRVVLGPPQSSSTAAEPCLGGRLRPYQDDYASWHREIGKLARKHRSLIGTGIDDFITGMGCPSLKNGRTLGRLTKTLRRQSGRPLDIAPTIYLKDAVPHLGGAARVARLRSYCRYSRPSHVTFAHVDAYNAQAKLSFNAGLRAVRTVCPTARITVMVYAGGRDRPDLNFRITRNKTKVWTYQATRSKARIVYYSYPLRELGV